MPYALPTVAEFKAQFSRDFPYAVPAGGARADVVSAAGVVTALNLVAGGQGYKDLPTVEVVDLDPGHGSGATATVTIKAGKVATITLTAGGANYSRPAVVFTGGSGDDTDPDYVQDADIAGAILDAQFNTNQALFDTQALFSRAFLYLAAHLLVDKLLMAGEGLASQYNWLTASKGVGDVSESFQIPQQIIDEPLFAGWSKTRYGAMYLQIISPLLTGNIASFHRNTLP